MAGKRFALAALGALIFAAAAPGPGQGLSVGPNTLVPGSEANISHNDPSRAGHTVLVEIDNGSILNPQYDYVLITLDQNGNGSTTWTVPSQGWNRANFHAPQSQGVTLPVGEGAGSDS